MDAIEYFKKLDKIGQRLSRLCYSQKKRILNEYDYMVGESQFSQIEQTRILNHSKK